MKNQPITHLILGTTSSNEFDDGDCDYCLVPMTAEYVAYLLGYMDKVRRLHRADNSVYSLECFDCSPRYFKDNDRLQELRDIDGQVALDVLEDGPVLLTANPGFIDDDYQRVDCQGVLFLSEDVWWTAYVKHTGIRIETAHVDRRTLLRVLRSHGSAQTSRRAKK